jgi:hypothetical protein
MSRIKVALVTALVAALAISVTAASAQAHVFKINGAAITESHNLKAENFTGNYLLEGKPFGVAVKIECTKVKESGSIGTGGTGSATLKFTSCTVKKPAGCTVKEPIETSVSTLLVGPTPGVELEFKPSVGETFTTITLEGASCSLKEPFKVNGTQTCELPGAGTNQAGHEINCTAAGSALTAGGKPATFSGKVNPLELEGKENWSAE